MRPAFRVHSDEVVRVLVSLGGTATSKDIARNVGRQSGSSVMRQLSELEKEGRVRRTERGWQLTDAWHLGLVIQSLAIAAAWYDRHDLPLAHLLRRDEVHLRESVALGGQTTDLYRQKRRRRDAVEGPTDIGS